MTVTVQVPPAAIVPPENAIDIAPATGVKTGAPQPDVENVAGDATVMAPGELGKLSLNATPLSAVAAFGLAIWNVMAETPMPARVLVGENDLVITGGTIAVRVAVANPLAPVLVPDCAAETKSLTLLCAPAVVAVTFGTATLHVPLAARAPPENEIVSGAVVVKEPPHVAVGPLVATVRPEGKVSVKAMPDSAVPAFGLVTVNVKVEVPLTATTVGANAFVIVGPAGGERLTAQPVKVMLSSRICAVAGLLAPPPLMRNVVVAEPVAAAVTAATACHEFLEIALFVRTVENAPPLAEE